MNPLRAPPFYTIPGINPDDPISAQLEQIDQLNTLLLQDIDHNFARFHQVVTSKLLPEIKRFALASEPTREASRFWRSFFEQAASVKVPSFGEQTTTLDDTSSSQQYQQHHDHQDPNRSSDSILDDEASYASDERSFLYGSQDKHSSTPARKGQGHGQGQIPTGAGSGGGTKFNPDISGGTWASSVESPFEQLDRKLRDDLQLNLGLSGLSHQNQLQGTPTPSTGGGIGGEGATGDLPSGYGQEDDLENPTYDEYEEEPSVLINRKDVEGVYGRGGGGKRIGGAVAGGLDDRSFGQDGEELPSGSATPIPKRIATGYTTKPATTAAATPRQSQALLHNVLRAQTAQASPHASRNPFVGSSVNQQQLNNNVNNWNGIVDLRNSPLNPKMRSLPSQQKYNPSTSIVSDESDFLPPDMSPPVTLNFTAPTRNLSKTPAKDAAKMIMDDMLREISGYQDSPGMPTPPAFQKYAALEVGGMERMGTGTPGRGAAARKNLFDDDVGTGGVEAAVGGQDLIGIDEGSRVFRPSDDVELEEGEDSFDTAHAAIPTGYDAIPQDQPPPPASSSSSAGTARRYNPPRDSFGNTSSLDTIQPGKYKQAHGGGDYGGDSMSPATSEAAKVFGGAKASRVGGGGKLFSLHGPDEIHTFHGGRLEDGVSSPKDSPSYAHGLARMQSKGGAVGK